MLPKKGKRLPVWTGVLSSHETYAKTIAELLRREHGDSHRAVKQLMHQTGASERTIKHWLSAQHGPDSLYLLRLLVSSPVIRAFVVGFIETTISKPRNGAADRSSQVAARAAYTAGEAASSDITAVQQKKVSDFVPETVPIRVPDQFDLNDRQRWFLAKVGDGAHHGADELAAFWRVCLKTARRDISGLQQARLLEFVGSRRKGRYRLL